MNTSNQAPKAKKVPYAHTVHGDVRMDDFHWLRDRDNPDVIAYLEAENAYTNSVLEPLQKEIDVLYEEMVARIPEAESNVPVRHGAYYYYHRQEKSLQYPIYARKRVASRAELDGASEEVLLDLNELASDLEYYSISVQRTSPDHNWLAYLENTDGSDRHTLRIKDLSRNELLADTIDNIAIDGSLEWDATGQYLYYITMDDQQRPYRAWRHQVGQTTRDELLYEETDNTFNLSLNKSNSGSYLYLHAASYTSSEVLYLEASRNDASFELFKARQDGIEYELEHWQDQFLILTNEGAQNFQILTCPVHDVRSEARTTLVPGSSSRFIQYLCPFRNTLVIGGREEGTTRLWRYADGQLESLSWSEPVYTVYVGDNREYDSDEVLIQYQSFVTPRTTYAWHLSSGELQSLQVAPVAGAYNPDQYRQERIWVTAEDGVRVPLAAVYRHDTLANGPAPLILYGYGSYGITIDPNFDPLRLPVLDRGVIYVIAQIRGGSEMGRSWYEDGKMMHKRNTFTDYVAAAKALIERGYTSPDRMAARGRSAGGLLMGAVANLGGHLFRVMSPGVPFVDVVSTMLDDSIPLTSQEWNEWGNPHEVDAYHYMKSYSPYDNVEAKPYPHIFITAGLNDPRVAYWEPAKWAARLRDVKTDDNTVILKTHMGAGHFGSSGRLHHIKELAEGLAFELDKLGVKIS